MRREARPSGARPSGACGTHAPIYGGRGPHAPRADRSRSGLVAHMPRYAGVVAHAPQARPGDPARKRQPTRKTRQRATPRMPRRHARARLYLGAVGRAPNRVTTEAATLVANSAALIRAAICGGAIGEAAICGGAIGGGVM